MFTIRNANQTDESAILALGNNFELTPYMIDKKFRNLTDVKVPLLVNTQFSNSKIKILVACINHKVVGFISFIVEKELSNYISTTEEQYISILFLSVDEKYRKQGIATRLLKYCFEKWREQDITIVRVGTDCGNTNALSLYQKQGFNTILNWNIYRIYKDDNKPFSQLLNFEQVDLHLKNFPINILLKRAIPWFYDPKISHNRLHRFLIEKIMLQIQNNDLQWIKRKVNNSILSLTIKRDKAREEYYKIKGSLWTINDLFESENRGQFLPEFINTTIRSLPNFAMVESWVCAHDYETQKILLKTGMKFVYGGISLRREL
ncbi:MAG: GNAT family N-acetyltransferase [Spirochaetota bacterium]|nr:GNAT family N-acetyltransferase [Spirochaetota bacterium]